MTRVEREVDLRWLNIPYGLRKAQNALEEMRPGETLSLIVDAFAAPDLKSSLEDTGHKVEQAESIAGQSTMTLIVKKNGRV